VRISLGCGQPRIVAVPRVVPCQPVGHHLPVDVAAVDLQAGDRAAIAVTILDVYRHGFALCECRQPLAGDVAERLADLGCVDAV
jgi:hypothetical protein